LPPAKQLGLLPLSVVGDDESADYLRAEFAALPDTRHDPMVTVRPVSSRSELGDVAARYGRVWTGDSVVRLDFSHWSSSIAFADDASVEVRYWADVEFQRFRPRPRNWNFLSAAEELAKAAIYDGLDQAIQLQQMQLDQTFVHASSICRDGSAVVIAGWGGVGKTSSVMQLVREDGYRFLSDDLAVVSSAGDVFRSPKRMQIYPYNVVGLKPLEDELLGGRGPVERLQWHVRRKLRGPKGVRRRVAAEELFGEDRVAARSMMSHFIHLERGTWSTPRRIELAADEAASRSAGILVHEMNPLNEIDAALQGSNSNNPFSARRWEDRSKEILASALRGARCTLLRVPLETTPGELSDLVREVVAD
jgi:hypothetical protein